MPENPREMFGTVMPVDLAIDTSASAMQMAEAIFGTGIQVLSASYSGDLSAAGIYSGGLTTSPGVVPSDSGVILSTGKATDFTTEGPDPNISVGTTTDFSNNGTIANGNAGLTALAGNQTYDAALLTVNFVPDGNVITMQIVFSSEEYLEWVGQGFNDIVAVWVNGTQAQLTVGSGDISIDNINTGSNSNLYLDNPDTLDPAAAYNTEMDGLTVTLTLKAPVTPGETNTIIFGIADTGDGALDSNLLIAGDSVQVALVANDDVINMRKGDFATVDLRTNDVVTPPGALTITQINGIDVNVGDSVILPSGESITLNADGTISVSSTGSINDTVFSYTVADTQGNTDVAFVDLNTVPCFTAGTLIETDRGYRRVEGLMVGDTVMTRDNGPQTLRWIGRTLRRAIGADAPIEIAANTFGKHDRLVVSPNHRVLVTGCAVELATGETEVLIAAKHLDETGQTRVLADRSLVLYLHLLFDNHEIVMSNGLASESLFLPDCGPEEDIGMHELWKRLVDVPHRHKSLARPALRRREAALVCRGLWPLAA